MKAGYTMRVIWVGLMVSGLFGQLAPNDPIPRFSAQRIENTNFVEAVAIAQLLQSPSHYHQKPIRVRGTVTRLELHLDDSNHFINFVFFLKTGEDSMLVFGHHDRTVGDIQLTTGRTVEVQGVFWQERKAQGHRLFNQLEAHQVRFYPPLTPEQASLRSPYEPLTQTSTNTGELLRVAPNDH